jgi:hypothetical protein
MGGEEAMIQVSSTDYATRRDVWRAFPSAFKVRIAATSGKQIISWYVLADASEYAEYRSMLAKPPYKAIGAEFRDRVQAV